MIGVRLLLSVSIFSFLLCSVQTQCPQGQIQLASGPCTEVEYIEGCLTYSDTKKCSACEFNYDLVGDTCDYNPKEQIHCCESFGENGECSKCKSGLFLSDGACKQATINGCIAKNGGSCTNCASGFYLQNGRCVSGSKSCLSYDGTGKCLTCRDSYKLNGNNGCSVAVIQGCETINNNICTKCYSPFVLLNGVCNIPNCDAIDEYGCSDCSNGYILKDRLCSPLIKNCQIDARGVCAYCNPGFLLANSSCIPQGCSSFNPTTNQCQNCTSPRVLTNKRCQIKGCLVYRNGGCVGCDVGFRISQGQCIPVSENEFEVCRLCAAQFFLGKDQQCTPYQVGCVEYNGGVCSRCSLPFELVDGSCVIDGCTAANKDGCTNCVSPYILEQSSRVCKIRFCLRSRNGKCLSCQAGYTANADGVCVISDVNCLDVNTLGVCTTCVNGYHVEPTGCVKNLVGCVYTGSVCSSCVSPFKLSGNKCQIQGCTSYTSSGCGVCNTQTYYLSNGICLVRAPGCIYDNGVCTKCSQNFAWTDGQCLIQGCTTYSNSGCTVCSAPYQLFGKTCKIPNCLTTKGGRCVGCANGFVVGSTGRCVKAIDNCVEYSEDKCSICKVGYYLSATGNDCPLAVPGCVYLNGECNSCTNGYTFRSKRCFETDQNCLTTSDNGVCITCKQSFYVDQASGKCKQGDVNCDQYNLDGSCKICKSRYFVNEKGGCTTTVPGCIYTGSKCTSCIPQFTFSDGTCLIPGCDSLSYEGCLTCVPPYYLSSNTCKLKNCLLVSNKYCLKCQPNFLLISGQCLPNDGTCLTWSPQGICQTCKKGYGLLDGKCQFVDDNCVRFNPFAKCDECDSGYYLGNDLVCRRKALGCNTYLNGECVECLQRYFLWKGICFPFVEGCNRVVGKDCVECAAGYDLSAGICVKKAKSWSIPTFDMSSAFSWKPTSGFAPTTLSSRNYANASSIPSILLQYSSLFNSSYTNYAINGLKLSPFGWRSKVNASGEWVGFRLPQAQTFYKVIIQGGDFGAYVNKFVVSFRASLTDQFKEIPISFDSSSIFNGQPLTLEFPTPINAIQIRIVIKSYVKWPALRFDFVYQNIDQLLEWSGINNIDEIDKKIMGIASMRLDILTEKNGRYFMVPSSSDNCKQNKSNCYGKAVFCSPKLVSGMKTTIPKGNVKSLSLSYSLDGLLFNCYNNCEPIALTPNIAFSPTFKAKEVKVNLGDYSDNAELNFSFDTRDAN